MSGNLSECGKETLALLTVQIEGERQQAFQMRPQQAARLEHMSDVLQNGQTRVDHQRVRGGGRKPRRLNVIVRSVATTTLSLGRPILILSRVLGSNDGLLRVHCVGALLSEQHTVGSVLHVEQLLEHRHHRGDEERLHHQVVLAGLVGVAVRHIAAEHQHVVAYRDAGRYANQLCHTIQPLWLEADHEQLERGRHTRRRIGEQSGGRLEQWKVVSLQ
mmetsp:Transcript_51306/g.128748  ORF Transcript_51306/g.128748 Transcript_51306/m.128748 type:complete len:217 (+) Transcript_51306:55-705(+)